MTGADFLLDRRIPTNNSGTYGWNALVPRDVNGVNVYTGQPDRSDSSAPLPAEAAKKGSLNDVFGSFNGYKNMSYIIDGEDNGARCMDLLYAPGQLFERPMQQFHRRTVSLGARRETAILMCMVSGPTGPSLRHSLSHRDRRGQDRLVAEHARDRRCRTFTALHLPRQHLEEPQGHPHRGQERF